MSDGPDHRAIALAVATYWRDELMREDDQLRVCAHPVACVIAALEGETDPRELGIPMEELSGRLGKQEGLRGDD